MAVLASAQALAAQRQIDYTRDNEAEADRVGIRTLARSGYDPDAMVSMFTRMQTISRVNQGGERERTPDYLRTHPVTTLRISDVKQRVESVKREMPRFDAGRDTAADNPLIPSHLRVGGAFQKRDGREFGWARERIRAMSANTPEAAIREYERERARGTLNEAQRYGLAVARARHGQYAAAIKELEPLLAKHADDPWLVLGMADAEARSGKTEAADARLEAQLQRMPEHRPTALGYAQLLAERNTRAAGQRAQAVLRPLLSRAKDDPVFQKTFARASEVAGDNIRAGEAYAEAEFLNGRPERALVQLNTLLKRDEVDYYARARIEARIAAITPAVLELRRQGVRDDELRRRR
jgi:beta-barrel assembly-enhancing protease